MNLLVIDGQGGGLGKSIIEQIKKELPEFNVTAVGTNAIATQSMLKAGADIGATGENAVIYNSKKADVIIGAIGIAFKNAMHGEITTDMASAVADSDAIKIFIPITKCHIEIVGLAEFNLNQYISELIKKIKEIII